MNALCAFDVKRKQNRKKERKIIEVDEKRLFSNLKPMQFLEIYAHLF